MRLNRNCKAVADFYRSKDWQTARAMRIAYAHGLCEICGAVGTEVHHKVHITPKNVSDPSVTLSQDNLILLCTECHNREHGRFGGARSYEWDEEGNLVAKNDPKAPPRGPMSRASPGAVGPHIQNARDRFSGSGFGRKEEHEQED